MQTSLPFETDSRRVNIEAEYPGLKHSVVQQSSPETSFVMFNDPTYLSMEPVTDEDLQPITVDPATSPLISALRSATWSCNIDWYFIVYDQGIALLNVYSNQGFLCRKHSARFIEMFLERPHRRKRERRKKQ